LQHDRRRVARSVVEKESGYGLKDGRLFEFFSETFHVADAPRQPPTGIISVTGVEIAPLIGAEKYRERRAVIRAEQFVEARLPGLLSQRCNGQTTRNEQSANNFFQP
jgi:hypothetical protein